MVQNDIFVLLQGPSKRFVMRGFTLKSAPSGSSSNGRQSDGPEAVPAVTGETTMQRERSTAAAAAAVPILWIACGILSIMTIITVIIGLVIRYDAGQSNLFADCLDSLTSQNIKYKLNTDYVLLPGQNANPPTQDALPKRPLSSLARTLQATSTSSSHSTGTLGSAKDTPPRRVAVSTGDPCPPPPP